MTREELMNMSKKDLKNRLAELGKKAQALSGQELTDAMDEARNIGEILDEIKTREELMAAAAAAGNNDPEPGKGSEPGEGGEEPKNQIRAKNGKALKDGKAVSYKAKVLVNPRNAMTTERVAMPQHSSTEISPAFNNVSSLIDRVKTVPLPGGESYKRPYVVSYGDGAGSTTENATTMFPNRNLTMRKLCVRKSRHMQKSQKKWLNCRMQIMTALWKRA